MSSPPVPTTGSMLMTVLLASQCTWVISFHGQLPCLRPGRNDKLRIWPYGESENRTKPCFRHVPKHFPRNVSLGLHQAPASCSPIEPWHLQFFGLLSRFVKRWGRSWKNWTRDMLVHRMFTNTRAAASNKCLRKTMMWLAKLNLFDRMSWPTIITKFLRRQIRWLMPLTAIWPPYYLLRVEISMVTFPHHRATIQEIEAA